MLLQLARIAGLDAHILGTLFFRGWALLAGILTMLLIPACLPPEHQGFYFTFASLISIQIFFELGFNHVITQLVSHESALMLQATENNERRRYARRLASVRELSRRWYRIMATVFAIVVFISGALFFERQQALPAVEWGMPWAMLCVFCALNLYVSPQLAIKEGLGLVDKVAHIRLVQSMIGYIAMWTMLMLNARLWAAVIVPAVAAAISLWWVYRNRNSSELSSGTEKVIDDYSEVAITWRRDVFPLQWRIALSWISGYFIFQIYNPLIFANHGAAAAGQTGLALAAYTAILGLGMSWVNATSPAMSAAIARNDREELRTTFRRVAKRSLIFTSIAAMALVIGRYIGAQAGLQLTDRIADLPTLIFMGCATIGNCLIGSMAIFMRCHKEEPMLWNSLIMGIIMMIVITITSRYSVMWVFGLQAALTIFIGLPWTMVIFRRYWNRV